MSDYQKNNPIEKMLQLQQTFKINLPYKISAIETSWLLLREKKSPNAKELHLKLHNIVGTAGTYGASLVCNEAKQLELKIKLLVNNETILDDNFIIEVDELLSSLKMASEKWKPSSIPFIPEKKIVIDEKEENWQNNIFLIEDDIDAANTICKYLEDAGYNIFYYQKLSEFEKNYHLKENAAAIIMDMAFDEGHIAGAETIKALSEKNKNFPPVIFISVHTDIQARLAAVKAGSDYYITKPIIQHELLSALDKLTGRIKYKPYRVLMVDDEQDILDYYSTILQEKGIEVLQFVNPIEAYHAIDKFDPELILLDLYMEECTGFELAKVIRQNFEKTYIPIVYLSAETNTEVQLSAMGLGGDDFLTKSVDVEYFQQTIFARVKRSRQINDLNQKYSDALRESEYRLITLDQHAIISMADIKGVITFANEHFEKISGYSAEELIGKNHRIIKSSKHEDSFYKEMWKTISSGEIWNGQVCNKKKDGSEYWVDSTIVPFVNEKGLPYKYVSVRTDITEIKNSEQDAQESERRLLEQQHTLNMLSTVTDYVLLEEFAFFNIVTQRAAETMNIDRVSIWMFDKEHAELECRNLFQKNTGEWESGAILTKKDFPKYFSALENNSVISVFDAATHPSTSEFSKYYLIPNNIKSMLDIPIRRQGRIIGVICCENTHVKRTWHSDEQGFVSRLSDLVSLNLESSERKKVEEKLTSAKEEADSANSAKTEFLSSMSHELRTPMNAICGFSQLLLVGKNTNLTETQKSNVNEILKASDHLLELINEVLNLAKIESGKVELVIEKVNYSNILNECYSLVSILIDKRNIEVEFKFNGEVVSLQDIASLEIFLHVDRMRFKQVLLNLLSNAVKYNRDNGSITISCDICNEIARISVNDSGKGISKDNMADLFKSFNRLGEEKGNIEGSGIGLVITKKLVELMEGNIGVESEINEGSTFWVEFPLVSSTGKKKAATDEIEEDMNLSVKKKREYLVLYIEDNPANLRLVEQILASKDNVNMISAPEPNLGLELAYTKSPDLILLDINLPGMSGFEVLKKLKENDNTINTPVFAVSANAMLRDIEAGIEAGFDDYITKPIDVSSFLVSTMKVLNKL